MVKDWMTRSSNLALLIEISIGNKGKMARYESISTSSQSKKPLRCVLSSGTSILSVSILNSCLEYSNEAN